MRLTEKKEDGFYKLKSGEELYGEENGIRLVQVFGEYEDIEEELGIDLITLFKALKDGIYFIEEHPEYSKEYIKANGNIYVFAKHNVEYSLVYEHDDRILQIRWVQGFSIQTKRFYLQDYGKTWALTREELK